MEDITKKLLDCAETIQKYCSKKIQKDCEGCPFYLDYSYTNCWLDGDYLMHPSEWSIEELRKEKEK